MNKKRVRYMDDSEDGDFAPSNQFVNNEISSENENNLNVQDHFSQNLSKRKKRNNFMTQADESSEDQEVSGPATAGIIEKIILKNFMCHDSFELELGPQLNFIIGHNGSGKSAILTGISVCLGAKASDTNRGASIRSLIKDGRSSARITVIFKNEGSTAYKPETFGEKIIIERRLQRQGGAASSYFIRSENMKTVSTKKSVLDDILVRFNIPIDNPMAFLSQDKAREFLTSTSDAQKYQYFMSGSLITDTIDFYESVEKNIREVKEKSKTALVELQAAQKDYEKKRAEHAKYKQSDHLRKKLTILHGKVYWFKVMCIENTIEDLRSHIEACNEEIEAANEKIASIDYRLSHSDEERQKAIDEASKTTEALDKFANQYQELLVQVKKVGAEIQNYIDTIRDSETEIENNDGEIKMLKKSIEKEQRRTDSINGGSRDSLVEQVKELETERTQLEEKLAALREDNISFDRNMETDRIVLSKEKESSKRKIADLEHGKKELANYQQDKLAPFGNRMGKVLLDIKKEKRFHHQPIGPIGMHIKIKEKNKQWLSIINAVLNKTLDSFLVQDSHDHKLLDQILRANGIQKSIIVRRFEKFSYKSGCPEHFLTVLDAIDIDNEDVFYSVIDMQNIEKFVLEPDRSKVRGIIEKGDRRIMSVLSLLDVAGGQRSSGSNGNMRIDPVYYRRELPKLSVTNDSSFEEIKALDKSLATEHHNLKSIEKEINELNLNARERKHKLENEINHSKGMLDSIDRKVYKIRQKLDETVDMANIESFKSGVAELEIRNEQQRSIIQSLQEEKYSKEKKYTEAKNILTSQKAEYKQLQDLVEEKKRKIAEFDASTNILQTERVHFNQSISKRESRVQQYETKVVTCQNALTEFSNNANTYCSREEVVLNEDDTEETVIDEFNRVDRAVKEAESTMGRPYEEVLNDVIEAKTVVQSTDATLTSLREVYSKLRQQLHKRITLMENTIDFWIQEAKQCFTGALRLRGFSGDLLFDFVKKTLTMKVKTPKDEVARTIESLSGGEKSFTQIALLLSIWKPMRSRIRGLDEFDVYMDSVNRGIGIKLLLEELKKYPKSQTIFITPQDIADVGDINTSNVRIHRIQDPRRANNSNNHD